MRTAVAMRRHTMKRTWMLLFSLLFVATDAKDVDPHGVEAFAAVKPGSSEVYKAAVLPNSLSAGYALLVYVLALFVLVAAGGAAGGKAVGQMQEEEDCKEVQDMASKVEA